LIENLRPLSAWAEPRAEPGEAQSKPVEGAEQNTPWGSFQSAYQFNGKETDTETGYGYYGARYYAPEWSTWLTVDPLAAKYPSWTPYSFVMNNPITIIDPDGREVYIIGPDAEVAANQLNEATSLDIKWDPNTCKLTATGEPLNAAEEKLLEAINSAEIDVILETTKARILDSQKDGEKNIMLIPAMYEGSTDLRKEVGKVIANQIVNADISSKLAEVRGESPGEALIHEINEAFIGAKLFPGGDYKEGYNSAHSEAAKLDRVQGVELIPLITTDPKNKHIPVGLDVRKKGTSSKTKIY